MFASFRARIEERKNSSAHIHREKQARNQTALDREAIPNSSPNMRAKNISTRRLLPYVRILSKVVIPTLPLPVPSAIETNINIISLSIPILESRECNTSIHHDSVHIPDLPTITILIRVRPCQLLEFCCSTPLSSNQVLSSYPAWWQYGC